MICDLTCPKYPTLSKHENELPRSQLLGFHPGKESSCQVLSECFDKPIAWRLVYDMPLFILFGVGEYGIIWKTIGKPPKKYMKQKDPSMETFRMPGQIVGETSEFRRALVSLHLMCDLDEAGSCWVHKPVLWHLYGETGRAPPDFHDITPNWHRSWESLGPRVYPQGTTASASSCLGWCYQVGPS